MQKVTFISIDGAGHIIDANVWTFVDPWGERFFRQEVKLSVGEGLYKCELLRLDGGHLPHSAWWGEHANKTLLTFGIPSEKEQPRFSVRVGAFTFEGCATFPEVGKILFWPKSVEYRAPAS